MVEAAYDIQERRLSTAGRAEDRNEFLLSEGEINALERLYRFRGGDVIFSDLS